MEGKALEDDPVGGVKRNKCRTRGLEGGLSREQGDCEKWEKIEWRDQINKEKSGENGGLVRKTLGVQWRVP